MKKVVLFLIFSQSIYASVVFVSDIYKDFAVNWCKAYVYDESKKLRISGQDLDHIRLLIQLSADRAQLTLRAQDIALKTLELFWQAWQNVSQTRLNPSHERPFELDRSQCVPFDLYWDLIEDQEQCSKQYSEVAQRVVYGGVLADQLSRDAVEHMRSQARIYMVDALADIKKQLGALYDIAFEKGQDIQIDEGDEVSDVRRKFSFAEFILSYVPNLAMHCFIHADKTHNVMSAEAWFMLQKVQRIGNQVWHAIESARLAFYTALLIELDTYK